jgi:hypothetical protein
MIADQLQQAADAAAQLLDDRIIELARRFEAARSSAGCRRPANGQTRRGKERRKHDESTRMAGTTETPIWSENEPAKVESWRLHILLEAGYPVHPPSVWQGARSTSTPPSSS